MSLRFLEFAPSYADWIRAYVLWIRSYMELLVWNPAGMDFSK
jgi:hypothetical protein